MKKQYGSRRGFVYTYWYRFQFFLGRYGHYKQVDWGSVERLVFICKGNICRSAYAEAVAHSLGLEAISCGLDTIENAPANADAIEAADVFGFDLHDHITKPVMYVSLKKTDLLLAMEPWQIQFLENNLNRKHQYSLLGLWAKPALPYIHDPYGSSSAYFEKCFTYIQEGVQALAGKMNQ